MTGPASRAAADYGIETRAVHAGTPPDPVTGARNVPIYQTTAYVFEDADHAASLFNLQTFGYIYTPHHQPDGGGARGAGREPRGRPGGRRLCLRPRGAAARFYTLLEPGDDFLASRYLYGGSITQFSHTFPRLGWHGPVRRPAGPAAMSGRRSRRGRSRSSPRACRTRRGAVADLEGWPRSRTRTASRSSSTTRWRRRTCAGRSSGAPTSSSTP